ncbi:MAG: bifunctional [glutamate--ammonia ligase]-adenylyl-L-tyrosine phosphorylase/[glutamate--ammonia-ligase] adenylyltransferase [Deltaproteobacteria bacterium]|nr:bifunctional [glutamate--ammonia ligase]-adenylyl-L-tyrosine phosphorylase/[glutamate--ammonia-ligase] adenylyltransferase [Deltaproteobacteria bacterium]
MQRFAEEGGTLPQDEGDVRLLSALLSSGSYLPRLLEAEPSRFDRLRTDPFLRNQKPRARFLEEAARAVGDVAEFAGLQKALRLFAQTEMLRLGARQLGWGTTEEVAAELSWLADACLIEAIRFCDATLGRTHGRPESPEGPPSFVVIAMGKMGGEELNFSSDIDLIYFYSTDEGHAGGLSLHEYYAKLSQLVTRAIDESTEEGFIFRVDLRLRPEGRSGPMCNSVRAAEQYYETFGRTWERQALLRARPCAGDEALGHRVLTTLLPFVHRRSLDPEIIAEVLSLRDMFREGIPPEIFDVKLSPGGIRDCELVAQLLQLLHGGQRPDLRTRETPGGLQRLFVSGLLTDRERTSLLSAYRFLRTLEHHIQLENGAQTQKLPTDEATQFRLALQMGFPDRTALLSEIEKHRSAVRNIADTMGTPSEGPSGEVLRLLDPAREPEQIEAELAKLGFVSLVESRRAIESARARLPVQWLAEAIASPNPDRALLGFRDLVLRGSQGLMSLVSNYPQLTRMLAGLFGTSARLSRLLIANPDLWEPLLVGIGRPHPPESFWQTGLQGRLSTLPTGDEEGRLREIRRYQTEEILRIALHDVAGTLLPAEISLQLTRVAESCLRASIHEAAQAISLRYGVPDTELTVLGMGSVGAHETRYGSDLDLVFLFAHKGTTEKGMDYQEWFVRLTQRLIAQMAAWMPEGRLYEIDTRLRPSGQQGLLVTTYAAFARYHDHDAAPWERGALLRARPVYCGNLSQKQEADRFSETLATIAYSPIANPEDLRIELRRIRTKVEEERGNQRKHARHLRLSPGGLTDAEFIAAFGQLSFGRQHPSLQTTSPFAALTSLHELQLLPIAPPLFAEVLQDYAWLRRVGLRIRLLHDDDACEEWLNDEGDPVLARTLDIDPMELLPKTHAAMARIRLAYDQVFGTKD